MLLLISNGADINSVNDQGMTMLHDSCLKGFVSSVKVLIEHNCDTTKVCKRGLTASDYNNAYYSKKTLAIQKKIQKLLEKAKNI